MLTPGRKSETAAATVGIGSAVIAIACCAGLPAIAALFGGLTVGAVLGLCLGALILGMLAWAAAAMISRGRSRSRRARSERR